MLRCKILGGNNSNQSEPSISQPESAITPSDVGFS